MAAADDTASNQDDLLWDHSGDVESDPLLGRMSRNVARSRRPEQMHLSYEQARERLRVLDNTRYVLDNFVQESNDGRSSSPGSWWSRNCLPTGRHKVASYILIITAMLQIISLSVVSILDVFQVNDDKQITDGTCAVMIILQVLNLFFILLVSVRLVHQLRRQRLNLFLLVQTYIATLLLFAGIYTTMYRLQSKSWKFVDETLSQDPIQVIELYCKFLFFSVSTATLCGSDNVLPTLWYTCIFVSVQMLMSFVYFTSILGQTLQQSLGVVRLSQRQVQQSQALQTPGSNILSSTPAYPSLRRQQYGSGDATEALTVKDRIEDREPESPVLSYERGNLSINTARELES